MSDTSCNVTVCRLSKFRSAMAVKYSISSGWRPGRSACRNNNISRIFNTCRRSRSPSVRRIHHNSSNISGTAPPCAWLAMRDARAWSCRAKDVS
eukprot:1189619-Prorocentrum_minimum.AAC.4